MAFKQYLLEKYISEMIVIGNIDKGATSNYVIAFDKWIWLLNDKSPDFEKYLDDIKDKLKDKTSTVFDETDIYQFITNVQEHLGDVLAASISSDKDLYLFDYGSFKQDPKSSILIKKVVNQLKLKSASYIEDMESTTTKVPKKKITGNIPDVAYHGTSSKYFERIMKIGLRAGESRSNYERQGIEHPELLFFSTRIGEAMHHATHTAGQKGGYAIILEFDIPDKDQIIADYDIEKMTKTDKHYSDTGPSGSQKAYKSDPDKLSKDFGVYGYKGNIKPIFIKNVYVAVKPVDEIYNISDFKKTKPKTFLKQIDMGYFD